MDNEILQQLKDIHLPPAITFWPLAPGWYIVFLLSLALIIGLSFWIGVKYKQKKVAQKIFAKWETIKNQILEKPEDIELAAIFIRQLILLKKSRKNIALLYGENWTDYLKKTYPKAQMTPLVETFLSQGIYQSSFARESSEKFLDELNSWIKKVLQ